MYTMVVKLRWGVTLTARTRAVDSFIKFVFVGWVYVCFYASYFEVTE